MVHIKALMLPPLFSRRRRLSFRLLLLGTVFVTVFCFFFKWEQILAEIIYFLRQFHGSQVPTQPSWNAVRAAINITHLVHPYKDSITSSQSLGGCSLPTLDPWDPSILPYVTTVPDVRCRENQLSYMFTRLGRLVVNNTALEEGGYSRERVTCRYRYIHRVNSDHYIFLNEKTLEGESEELHQRYNSVWARCSISYLSRLNWLFPELLLYILGADFYQNVLMYIPRNINKNVVNTNKNKYSVIILIIDAMSSMNFQRTMPKTNDFLKKSGALRFKGYHKVGQNSYPNVMALLSGESGGDVCSLTQLKCDQEKKYYYIDNERQSLIPSLYRSNGYKTLWFDDLQDMSTFHRIGKVGFKKPPADLYFRFASLAIENEEWGYLRNRLIGKYGCYACLQNELIHKHQFRIIDDFTEQFQNNPYFMFLHLASYLHNDLNMARLYDSDLNLLLKKTVNHGRLNKTFFVLMGDHGFQRGEEKFTLTEQGRLENKLPLLSILPPFDFISRFPDLHSNMKHNKDKVTSHFDTNQLLRDILALGLDTTSAQMFANYEGHGQSLLSRLPSRTCAQASIPADFCTCQDGAVKLETERPDVRSLSLAVITDINQRISSVSLCQEFVLNQVNSAAVRTGKDEDTVFLQLETTNDAVFEVVVGVKGGKLEQVRVTRMDWYREKSRCVPLKVQHLRQYCICKTM